MAEIRECENKIFFYNSTIENIIYKWYHQFMLKRYLLIILAFSILPVFSGELENAFSKNKNVFLYLYTPDCGYCTKFTPRYDKLSKMYDGQYSFVKIDASTPYGFQIMRKYGGRYVPYVLLLNPKKHNGVQLAPSCLTDRDCVERSMKDFKS